MTTSANYYYINSMYQVKHHGDLLTLPVFSPILCVSQGGKKTVFHFGSFVETDLRHILYFMTAKGINSTQNTSFTLQNLVIM